MTVSPQHVQLPRVAALEAAGARRSPAIGAHRIAAAALLRPQVALQVLPVGVAGVENLGGLIEDGEGQSAGSSGLVPRGEDRCVPTVVVLVPPVCGYGGLDAAWAAEQLPVLHVRHDHVADFRPVS